MPSFLLPRMHLPALTLTTALQLIVYTNVILYILLRSKSVASDKIYSGDWQG